MSKVLSSIFSTKNIKVYLVKTTPKVNVMNS